MFDETSQQEPASITNTAATPMRTNLSPAIPGRGQDNRTQHTNPPLQAVKELPNTDSYKVGIQFCVNNNRCNILNLVVAFLETINEPTVLNYAGEASSALSLQEVLKFCHDRNANIRFYSDFLGVKDEVPRNKAGDTLSGRRYCALYIPSRTTFREMRHKFNDKIGGISALQHLGWYISYYADTEPIQRMFAVVLGKNPRHGYGPDYAKRVQQFLLTKTGTLFNITSAAHNETLSDGTRVRVMGLQVGRSVAQTVERELRASTEKEYNGIRLRYKSNKRDRKGNLLV